MKNVIAMTVLAACALTIGADKARATEDECRAAQTLVDTATNHYKTVGQEKAYADFMDKGNADWVNNGHYVTVSTMDGIYLVYARNPKLTNNPDLPYLKDTDGILFVQEMAKAGKSSPNGAWVKYTWLHPITNKLSPTHAWVKPSGNLLFIGSCNP